MKRALPSDHNAQEQPQIRRPFSVSVWINFGGQITAHSVYHRAKRRRTLMAQESRISIKALLVGAAVDLVGSSLFGLIWGFCVAVIKAGQGDTFSEKSFYSMDPWALLIVLLIGLCYTALGGYVAAVIAKRSPLLHGAIIGGLTLPWFLVGTSAVPSWYLVVGVLGVIPFGILGGMLSQRRQRASSAT